jgi:uncharacterized protein involved in exopolysaccharide biosynthesis
MSQDSLSLQEFLGLLRQYQWLFFSVLALCLVAAVAVAVLSAPVYRGQALVAAAEDNSSSSGDLSSIVSRFSSIPGVGALAKSAQQEKLAEGMATLKSPQFLADFIREENLLPVLFSDQWDSENKQWLVDDPSQIPTEQDAWVLFREELLSIGEDKVNPGIVVVAIEWTDREQAASWVNLLIERLNNRLRKKAIDEADKTIAYLNKELEKARIVQLRQSIFFMIEAQINLRTMANVREEFVLKVISPAVVSDEDRYIRPNRPFTVVMGGIIGVVAGVFACFLAFFYSRLRQDLNSQAR